MKAHKVQYRSKPHQKVCGMKLLNTRGELERTKRLVKAAFVLWQVKEGIRPSRGFADRMEFGRRTA